MNKLLLERMTLGEFTFGFEFEAFKVLDDYSKFLQDVKRNYNDEDYFDEDVVEHAQEEYFPIVKKEISSIFGLEPEKINLMPDGSLRSTNEQDDMPLEWGSPVMPFTPQYIQNCVQGLYSLISQNGYYTNESCGFHIHLSFPNITEEDAIWIISKLAVNEHDIQSVIQELEGILFYNEDYASFEFLKSIEENIKKGDFYKLKSFFTDTKYRVIRIHPQGTLEWRGPRNFMNNKSLNMIKKFFNILIKFVQWIRNVLSEKEIEGINKREFFKLLKGTTEEPKLIPSFKNSTARLIKQMDQTNNLKPLVIFMEKLINSSDKKEQIYYENVFFEMIITLLNTHREEIGEIFDEHFDMVMRLNNVIQFPQWNVIPLLGQVILTNENNLSMFSDLLITGEVSDIGVQNIISMIKYFHSTKNLTSFIQKGLRHTQIEVSVMEKIIETSDDSLMIMTILANTDLTEEYNHIIDIVVDNFQEGFLDNLINGDISISKMDRSFKKKLLYFVEQRLHTVEQEIDDMENFEEDEIEDDFEEEIDDDDFEEDLDIEEDSNEIEKLNLLKNDLSKFSKLLRKG